MKKALLSMCFITTIAFSQNQINTQTEVNNDISNINGVNNGETIFQTSQNFQYSNQTFQENVKIDPFGESYSNPQYTQTFQEEKGKSQNKELNESELELLKSAIRNRNLNALQKKFFYKNYSGFENTTHIDYIENKTHKIRTRFAMATTLIFSTDITSYILGDTTGFKIEEIPNLSNAISIKPMLIGIDTSLTIFTRDNKIHTFYIFSTDYKNQRDPALVIYINDKETKKQILKEQEKIKEEYLVIKEGIAEIKVKKSDIHDNYIQKCTNKDNQWLKAEEIFDDKKFTYFKYDKSKNPQIPTIFAVIDEQDSPVETRVIGNYIIAETINRKFSIKSGNSYVCVERLDKKKASK